MLKNFPQWIYCASPWAACRSFAQVVKIFAKYFKNEEFAEVLDSGLQRKFSNVECFLRTISGKKIFMKN